MTDADLPAEQRAELAEACLAVALAALGWYGDPANWDYADIEGYRTSYMTPRVEYTHGWVDAEHAKAEINRLHAEAGRKAVGNWG